MPTGTRLPARAPHHGLEGRATVVDTGVISTDDAAPAPRRRGRGGLVTVGTVVALVVAMGLTVLGLGAADHAVANYDAASWLWSSSRGEMSRVNGVTGRVDTRLQVPGTQGHTMQVTQTDKFLVLRDMTTGKVSALDLATLQVTATTQTTAGLGVSDVRDRDYFQSIYFGEPRGILFEIATLSPGFAVDEDPAHLGEELCLPAQHEHLRAQLERLLTPVTNPRSAEPVR